MTNETKPEQEEQTAPEVKVLIVTTRAELKDENHVHEGDGAGHPVTLTDPYAILGFVIADPFLVLTDLRGNNKFIPLETIVGMALINNPGDVAEMLDDSQDDTETDTA